jgi:hypothetical protein
MYLHTYLCTYLPTYVRRYSNTHKMNHFIPILNIFIKTSNHQKIQENVPSEWGVSTNGMEYSINWGESSAYGSLNTT